MLGFSTQSYLSLDDQFSGTAAWNRLFYCHFSDTNHRRDLVIAVIW